MKTQIEEAAEHLAERLKYALESNSDGEQDFINLAKRKREALMEYALSDIPMGRTSLNSYLGGHFKWGVGAERVQAKKIQIQREMSTVEGKMAGLRPSSQGYQKLYSKLQNLKMSLKEAK